MGEPLVLIVNPIATRARAGLRVRVEETLRPLGLAEVVAALRGAGLAVLAADGTGEHDLDDLLDHAARVTASPGASHAPGTPDLTRPTAWVFGNEAWGLPAEDRGLADAVVRVPLRGRAESLNLATAATLCLYASGRAQR